MLRPYFPQTPPKITESFIYRCFALVASAAAARHLRHTHTTQHSHTCMRREFGLAFGRFTHAVAASRMCSACMHALLICMAGLCVPLSLTACAAHSLRLSGSRTQRSVRYIPFSSLWDVDSCSEVNILIEFLSLVPLRVSFGEHHMLIVVAASLKEHNFLPYRSKKYISRKILLHIFILNV